MVPREAFRKAEELTRELFFEGVSAHELLEYRLNVHTYLKQIKKTEKLYRNHAFTITSYVAKSIIV